MKQLLALTLLVCACASDNYDQPVYSPRNSPPPVAVGGLDMLPPADWWHQPMLADAVRLNADQIAALDKIPADDSSRLERDMMVAMRDVRSVLDSKQPTNDDIVTAGQRVRALRDSLFDKQIAALRQAEIDQQMAAEDLRQARAVLLPRVRDAFTLTYNSRSPGTSDPSFIAQNAVHEYQNLIGVTGDLHYGLIAAIRRSRALLEVARAGTEVARRALGTGVNEAYYGAALATAKRGAAEQSLAAAQEFERVTDLNYRAGEVPEVDAIRARWQTAARRDDLAQARQAEAIANASLSTLLGTGIATTPAIEPLPQAINVQDVESLTVANVPRRPEFRQLEAQVRAAEADIR